MNMFHYPRQWAQGVLVLCAVLLTAASVSAQCTLSYSGTPPLSRTLELDGIGLATIDAGTSPVSVGGPGCYLEFATSAGGPWSATLTYDCNSIATSPNTAYVRGTDGSFTTASVQLLITVEDNLDPVVNAPVLPTFPNDLGVCYWTATGGAADADPLNPPSDNCGIDELKYVLSGATSGTYFGTLDGVQFNTGNTTVTATATDPSGNVSAPAVYVVAVNDTELPTDVCPTGTVGSPIIVPADAGTCSYTGANGKLPWDFNPNQYFSDNCGVTSITYRYQLDGGALTSPAPVTAANEVNGIAFPITANTHLIRYRAFDAAGNSHTCQFHIRVVDSEDPVLASVQTNASIGTSNLMSAAPDPCEGRFNWNHPTVSDNSELCTPVGSLTQTIFIDGPITDVAAAPFTEGAAATYDFELGVSFVIYTVTDAAGNSATASFSVTVVDDEAPSFLVAPVPSDVTVSVNAGSCDKVITWTRPSIGSPIDCGPVTMTETVVPNGDGVILDPTVLDGLPAFNAATGGGSVTTNFPSGETVIRYSWVDNSASSPNFFVDYSFFVDEDEFPVAQCQNLTLQLDANGQALLTTAAANSGSSDNCPGFTMSINYPVNTPAGANATLGCSSLGTTNYQLVVTDAANNTTTSTNCTVTVLDNIAPTVACPVPVTVNAAAGLCTATIGTAGDLAFDLNNILLPGEYDNNCDLNNITITATATPVLDLNGVTAGTTLTVTGVKPTVSLSGVVFPKGLTTIAYTLTDVAGNAAACTFTVNVVDNQAPVVTLGCPPNITVNANIAPGCAYKKPNSAVCIVDATNPLNQWCGTVTFNDNCDGLSTVSNLPSLTQTYNLGVNPISITKTDAAGNVGTCNFTITVQDNTPPVALCQDVTVELNSSGNGSVTALQVNNGSNDNCYFDLLYAIKEGAGAYAASINYNCMGLGQHTVTLQVTEDGGVKSSTTDCFVTVVDLIAPSLTCPSDVTVNLGVNGQANLTVSNIAYTASDNCTNPPVVVGLAEAITGPFSSSIAVDCADLAAAFPVYLQVRDASLNTQNCTVNVHVEDVTAPSFSITNANVTAQCGTTPAAPVFVVSDVCDGTGLVPALISSVTTTGANCVANKVVETTVNTWRVTDSHGNSAQAVQTITIRDEVAPFIDAPANTTINLVANATCYPTGSYSVLVSDECSDAAAVASTTWVITYADGAPSEAGSGLTATSLTGFATGVNTITFTSTDACGNTATQSFTVTVVDGNVPVFNQYFQPPAVYNGGSTTTPYCGTVANPVMINIDNAPNNCGATFEWFRPYAGPFVDFGFAQVFSDVEDCNPVTLAEQIVLPSGGTLNTTVPFVGGNPINSLVQASQFLPVGTTTFTYTATAATGLGSGTNSSVCVFQVKVKDTQPVSLNGSQTATLNSICPTQTVPDYRGQVQIIDNCPSNVTLTQSIVSPNSIPWTLGTTTLANVFNPAAPLDNATFVVRITANDGFNPPVTRDITVTLNDNVAPVPNVATLTRDTSNCGYIILMSPTAKTNDCGPNTGVTVFGTPGGVNATANTVSGGNITSYKVTLPNGSGCQTYFVTWSYNDGNGNVSTQLQEVKICPDVVPPTAKCKTTPISVTLNQNGNTQGTLTVADVNDGSFDLANCNPFTLSLSKTNFTCADVSPNNTGATTVTLTATDNANSTLSSTCNVQVKVLDNVAPVFTASPNPGSVPANITLSICSVTDQGQIPATATVTATDNCSATVAVAQTSTQTSNGAGKYNYVITRTWTAKDVFGNATTASQTITVRDTLDPVLTAPTNLTFNTTAVSDSCSATVSFNVANYVADCAPDNELNIVVNPPYFSLTDNSQVLEVGNHVVNFTVTDPAGNTSTGSVTIVVKDVTKPTASCINGISVALNSNGQAIVTPGLINNQSDDNCTMTNALQLQVQQLDGVNGDTIGAPAAQLTFDCGEADSDTEYPIILWVKDASGNFSFCETYVVIQDNEKPVISCPANKTVECSPDLNTFSITVLGNATATDNCNNNVVGGVTYPVVSHTDAPTNNGYQCQSIQRTFSAVDLAGNVATCVQSITVQDTKPPVFLTKPPSDTVACNDPLVSVPVLGADDVADNCTPADSIKITFSQVKTDSVGVCGKYSYKVTRTWVITDKCGNSNNYSQVLLVYDSIAPVLTFPGAVNDTIKIFSAGLPPTTDCTVFVGGLNPLFEDCALVTESTIDSIVFSPTLLVPITPSGLNVSGNYPVGTTRVTFKVTDPCGNVARDTIYVTVIDNTSPVAKCLNISVMLANDGQATITPADVNNNSYDNCSIAPTGGLVLSQSAFDCQDLGIQTVTLTVTDIYGNSNTCQAAVTVGAGSNTGFALNVTGVPTTYFGAVTGSASATATGGSGNFTYNWSTTATTSSISGLAAGTYTVTVIDQFTGCQQVDTAIVVEGPSVTFSVGTASGTQGTTVKVPVYAQYFNELSSFSFSIDLQNLAVGTILAPDAITNINPAFNSGDFIVGVNGNNSSVGIIWSNTQTPLSVTLPASNTGQVELFKLCVQLSSAPLGTISPLVIDGSPTELLAIREGVTQLTPVIGAAGSVQITLGLDMYDINGDIALWKNYPTLPVANVKVDLTGSVAAQTLNTPASGQYDFLDIAATSNTVTTPSKTTTGPSFNSGITVADHILIKQHLGAISPLTPTPFTSPYQFVAADVNLDGKINSADLGLVQRVTADNKRLLDISPSAPKDWVFIPAVYTFPAFGTSAPFPTIPAYPQTIDHTPIFQDELNDDFVAVRLGDVNGNTPLTVTSELVDDRSGDALVFRVQDQEVVAGETFEVNFHAKDFANRMGYQFTLGFDPNVLEVADIAAGNLPGLSPDNNFGTLYLPEGNLTSVWSQAQPLNVANDEVVFTVKFKALHNSPLLSQSLSINSAVTPVLAVNGDFAETDVQLEFTPAATSGTGTLTPEHAVLYQNQPNPFQDVTTIGFRLAASERATVRIYSAEGALVKTVIGQFEKGYNAIQFRNSDLGATGVYYYELSTPSFSDRKKMVLID